MARLSLRRDAREDLRAIDAYSRREFGDLVADGYMDEFDRLFERLATFPQSGPVWPGLHPPIRYAVVNRHLVFYDLDGDEVVIVRVLHRAMNVEEHLRR